MKKQQHNINASLPVLWPTFKYLFLHEVLFYRLHVSWWYITKVCINWKDVVYNYHPIKFSLPLLALLGLMIHRSQLRIAPATPLTINLEISLHCLFLHNS